MRLLRIWGVALCAALSLGAGASVAVGQSPLSLDYPECTKKPTPQDIEGAKGAHKAASQFYERAEYEKAIRYWNDAYAFDCTANDLLLNIANAYEKMGDRASTISTLETYIKRTGPNPTLEQKVKNLKAAMAPPTPTVVPTAPPTVVPTAPPPPSAAPVAPPTGPRPHGITPWILVGGGGALAVVGAILLPVGYSAISSAAETCPDRGNCPNPDAASKGNAGRTQAGVGWGLLSVGVAAAGGGLVWQLLFNKPAPAPAAPRGKTGLWMSPVAGPGQTGVMLGGRF